MFVVQRVDALDVWHDLAEYTTFGAAQADYLSRTPFNWHRIIHRIRGMDLIVR
jgi:hypothetical protein